MSTLVTHFRKVSRKKLLFFWILSKLLTHSFMPLRLDWCDFDMFKTITQNLLMLLLLVMLTFKIMLTIAWLQLTAWQQLARFGKSSTPAFQHLSTVLIFLSTLGTSLSKLVSLFFCVVTMSRALNPWVLCAFYNVSSLTYSCQSSFLLECPLSGHFAHDSARWFPQFTVFTKQKVMSIVCVWGEEREKEKEKKQPECSSRGSPTGEASVVLGGWVGPFPASCFPEFSTEAFVFLGGFVAPVSSSSSFP